MSASKYLYIDDGDIKDSEGIVRGLLSNELSIEVRQPKHWKQQLQIILTEQENIDGLILDLRLDDNPNDDGDEVEYRGLALAQEIRTLATEKDELKKDFPIVLVSATAKFAESFDSDLTGHNLFDLKLEKEQISENVNSLIQKQLLSLASGYKQIQAYQNNNESSEMLGNVLSLDKVDWLDRRLIDALNERQSSPVHELARFILSELIWISGPLITEYTLAARLGVDIEASQDNWLKLKEYMEPALYKGVFHQGWERYWMHKIEQFAEKELNITKSLRRTPAHERVEAIKELTHLQNLVAAKKLNKSSSNLFWEACKHIQKPLDTTDGLVASGQDNYYPWQGKSYISIDEALNGAEKNVASSERERLKKLKQRYNNERVRRRQ